MTNNGFRYAEKNGYRRNNYDFTDDDMSRQKTPEKKRAGKNRLVKFVGVVALSTVIAFAGAHIKNEQSNADASVNGNLNDKQHEQTVGGDELNQASEGDYEYVESASNILDGVEIIEIKDDNDLEVQSASLELANEVWDETQAKADVTGVDSVTERQEINNDNSIVIEQSAKKPTDSQQVKPAESEARKTTTQSPKEENIQKSQILTKELIENSGPDIHEAVYKYEKLIKQAVNKYSINKNLLLAIVDVESEGNPNAVSWVGALGLGQLMPKWNIATLVDLGYLPKEASWEDYKKAQNEEDSRLSLEEYETVFFNPEANLNTSACNLKWLTKNVIKKHPSWSKDDIRTQVMAAGMYNGGGSQLNKLPEDRPEETRKYIRKVGSRLIRFKIEKMISDGLSVDEVLATQQKLQDLVDTIQPPE